jgi:hypothetical protein
VYAWDASDDADTAITGKRMVVYLVRPLYLYEGSRGRAR